MIFVIDDDRIMAKCIARATRREAGDVRIFGNVYDAIDVLSDELPEMIFMDVLLTGPDGFTLLNELSSYSDTAKIPIVIVSALNFAGADLSDYGVVGVLNKETMLPEEIKDYVTKYTQGH